MGCCFSDELNNNKNEKMSLLQKPTKEEASENGISTTLTSILDTLERQELHVMQGTVCGEAACHDNCMESVKCHSNYGVEMAEGGHISSRPSSHQLDVKKVLSLEDCEPILDVAGEKLMATINGHARYMNNGGSYHINSNSETGSPVVKNAFCAFERPSASCVPMDYSQGSFFPNTLTSYVIKNNTVMDECLLLQGELEPVKSNCNSVISSRTDTETVASAFAYLDIDRHHRSTRNEFYSICVVDDDVRIDAEEGQEMFSKAWPLDSIKEFRIQKPVQVPSDISTLKDASYNIKGNDFMPKSEIEIKTSVGLQNGVHRLNSDSLQADGLRAQAHAEEQPQNSTQEMDMLDSGIFVNESVRENSDSPTPVHIEKNIQYSLLLENMTCACRSTLDNGTNYETDSLPFGFSENLNIAAGENLEQLLGNPEVTSEDYKIPSVLNFANPSNSESQENNLNLKSRQAFTAHANTFWAISAGCDEGTPNYSEEDAHSLEQLLKHEDVSHFEAFCSHENISDRNIKMLSATNSFLFERASRVPEFSSNEDGSCINQMDTQKNGIPLKSSSLDEGLWENENTLTFSGARNVNGHKRIQKENCLEIQVQCEDSKIDATTHEYSSPFNDDNSCSDSSEHSELGKVDFDDEHCKLQDKCSFQRLEEELRIGASLHNPGLHESSCFPEQSTMKAISPFRPIIAGISAQYEDALEENTKHSHPGSSLCNLEADMECAFQTNSENNLTSNLEGCKDADRVCIDPKQVDKYAATPSYEIPLVSVNDQESEPGNEKHVLDLMEDILKESSSIHKMDISDCQDDMDNLCLVHPLCQSAPLSRLLSATNLTDDPEYLMGYLWMNSSLNKIDSAYAASEPLQNQAQELLSPSLDPGKYPYQLLIQQNCDIWGWQGRDGDCILMLHP
uniref:Uncharacterized protein n=1 Tax=Anolis carolinensis TaxID=28377 RepID=A0A803SUD1_ANOCA